MNYLLSDDVYSVLKWIGLVLCPALAVLVATVGPAWGMPYVEQTVTTINAVGLFIGALIGVSQAHASISESYEDWE